MAKSESAGWRGLLWSRCQLFGIASNAQVVVHGGEAVTATNSLGRRPATCHTVLRNCAAAQQQKCMSGSRSACPAVIDDSNGSNLAAG